MDCYVTSLMFHSDAATVEMLRSAWKSWIKNSGRDLLKQMGFGLISSAAYGQGATLEVMNRPLRQEGPPPTPLKVQFPNGANGLVPKGLVVRLDIFSVLNLLDLGGCDRQTAIYLMVDGSGAFEFESIELVLNALLARKENDVALGVRPTGQSGMEPWRLAVEDFEHYLLFYFLGDEVVGQSIPTIDATTRRLPDGQAGCWAFRARAAKSLPLTARGYEIEFDLLSSAIQSGLRVVYSEPLKMGTTRASTSTGGQIKDRCDGMCREKLLFIMHKLSAPLHFLHGAKEAFCRDHPETALALIPSDYWTMVDQLMQTTVTDRTSNGS